MVVLALLAERPVLTNILRAVGIRPAVNHAARLLFLEINAGSLK
jgi:hypothetical protein